MDSFINQESNHGIMDEHPSSYSDVSSETVSSNSDVFEDVDSSSASSSVSSSTSKESKSSLHDMSSLLQQLPFKRGISKHYNGRSQSFSCLSNATCLEDLTKHVKPLNKKLKYCKSYAVFDVNHGSKHRAVAARSNTSLSSSKLIKKASRGSCSSLCAKRNGSFLDHRSLVPPPHKSDGSSCFNTQAPLFALGV